MRYLSICSGIEAATVAWHHLGWTPVAFSEIEPFPSAVLAHHYPSVPNLGDMTNFKEWNLGPVDLLVGGTPCQSFSVAGLRKGLDDPRGNLMLTFLAIAERHRPQWIVWENVPGVLSSNKGRDFGTFLGALGELGYGWAYRVLDAQWFGVAQRRRRVFVVACLGDQASAAAVLFESESVQRNPSPSRETRQGVARGVTRCFAGSSESGVAATLETTSRDYSRAGGFNMVAQPVAFHPTQDPISSEDGTTHAMGCGSKQGTATVAVAHAFKIRGGVEREDGSRGSTNIGKQAGNGYLGSDELAFTVASSPDQYLAHHVTFAKTHKPMSATDPEGWSPVDAAPTITHWPRDRSDAGTDVAVVYERHDQDARVKEVSVAPTLHSKSDNTCDLPMVMQPVGTDCYNGAITGDVAATIGTPGSSVNASGPTVMQAMAFEPRYYTRDNKTGGMPSDVAVLKADAQKMGDSAPHVAIAMQVRRLTPVECERLQGFPDGYTNIPWRKKPEAPDGPRYKALGNSMAVPCMKWIGERIQAATARQEVKP